MRKETLIIYYDYEPNIGINATCVDWSPRNEYFSSWSEFLTFVNIEYPTNHQLVEITSENYLELCAMGVFYEA